MSINEARQALQAAFPDATNMSIQPDIRWRNGEWSMTFDVYVHPARGELMGVSNMPTAGLAVEAVIAKSKPSTSAIDGELNEVALAIA